MRTERLLLALVALLTCPAVVVSQARSSVIRGVIVSGESRRPIEGARIALIGTTHAVTTDVRGAFSFGDLEAGRYVIQAVAIGFTTLSSPLMLKERETLDVQFEAIAQAVNLPELRVSEEANHGPADWLRRKSEGQGRYITRAQIEERRAASIGDALRMVPGVRIECRGAMICAARMARSPRGCGPGYFMDGIPADAAVLWMTPVQEIEGIEVYSGPSQTPPELEGGRTRCGAIALWTRPPPPRQPKEKKQKADTAAARADTLAAIR